MAREIKKNKLSEDTKKSMLTRTITAIVLAILAVPAIIFGRWWFLGFVIVALIIIVHEFVNAPKNKKYGLFIHGFIYLMTFSFVFWIMVKNNLVNVKSVDWIKSWSFDQGFWTVIETEEGTITSAGISVSTIGVVLSAFVLFFMSITYKTFDINDVTYLFTMSVLIGISIQAVLFLRYFPVKAFSDYSVGTYHESYTTSLLLFYVIIGTFVTDAGAYFIGVLFGKTKMNERISPKKTWEGFVGGVVLSFVISFAFAIVCDSLGSPILPFLTKNQWYWILVISLMMPFIANLGDFIFSALKRHFNIKDYGTLLRGHGGVLDRVDSLLCVSLAVAIFIIFLNNGWDFLI